MARVVGGVSRQQGTGAMSAELVQAATPPRWRPTPAIAGSIGLHCLAGASTLVALETWPWALGALAANHLVLGIAGMVPRSTLLGPNVTRLPPAAAHRRVRRAGAAAPPQREGPGLPDPGPRLGAAAPPPVLRPPPPAHLVPGRGAVLPAGPRGRALDGTGPEPVPPATSPSASSRAIPY